MFSFVGRGVFYIFIGCIVLGESWFQYIPGGLVTFIGIAYVVLEYVPSIEPPANMRWVENKQETRVLRLTEHDRDADQGWGAEQV